MLNESGGYFRHLTKKSTSRTSQ